MRSVAILLADKAPANRIQGLERMRRKYSPHLWPKPQTLAIHGVELRVWDLGGFGL